MQFWLKPLGGIGRSKGHMESMERALRTGTVLEADLHMDRLDRTFRTREVSAVDMPVMVMHTELPQGCTCTRTSMTGGDRTHSEDKGDCGTITA